MPEENNTWQNKFNPSQLDKEDWLEPSDGVFAAIEEEIYGKKKEKRYGFIIALFITFLLFTAGTAYLINKDSVTDEHNISEVLSQNVLNKSTESQATRPSLVAEETVETKENGNINVLKKTDGNIRVEKEENKLLSGLQSNRLSTLFNNQNVAGTQNRSKMKLAGESRLLELNKTSLPYTQSLQAELLKNNYPTSKEASRRLLTPLVLLSALELKPEFNLKALEDYTKGHMINSTEAFIAPEIEIDPVKRNQLYFGSGFGQAIFTLNDNFSSAVSPADFRHSEGNSINAVLGYQRTVSSKLSLFVDLDYNRTKFNSGHNSNYEYKVATENNQSNTVDLTMATPLGFMVGQAVIERSSDMVEQTTSLVLDLQNTHSYHSLGLTTGLNYRLFSNSMRFFEVSAGVGAQGIFGLKNQLVEVNNSIAVFNAKDKRIISDQTTINLMIPRSILALGVGQKISPQSDLKLEYSWIYGLKAIHSQDDLSTGFQMNRILIKLSKNL